MPTVALTLDRLVEIIPGVCGDKPRLAGHRVRVVDAVIWLKRLVSVRMTSPPGTT